MKNDTKSNLVGQFIEQYRREYDFFEQASRLAHSQLETALASSGIRAIVTYRAKRPDRLERKLLQRLPEKNYQCIGDIYNDIVDFSGVRVALYFPAERSEVDKVIHSIFSLIGRPKQFPENSKPTYEKRFSGYWATHYRVRLKDVSLHEPQKRYLDAAIEIQVASVLMHSWSEVEHDLVYKPLEGTLSDDEYAILDELNGLVLSGEIALERLQRAIEKRVAKEGTRFTSHFELASFILQTAAPIVKSGVGETALGRVDVLFDLLTKLNLNTPEHIRPLIAALHTEFERRSISDQIIDQVLASDERRYNTYSGIRRKLETDSTVHSTTQQAYASAFSEFLKTWVEFEKKIFNSKRLPPTTKKEHVLSPTVLSLALGGDQQLIKHIERIRMLRNKTVHGHGDATTEELSFATQLLREILNKLKT